jgi:hypothetical protein
VDLGAEITPFSAKPSAIPQSVAGYLGSISDLLTPAGKPSLSHAVLLLVRYPQVPGHAGRDPWLARTHTWVLYIKATVTGDEPVDVRNYAAMNPDFPNETTLDQMFDEPQWESYRALGDHIGGHLFT